MKMKNIKQSKINFRDAEWVDDWKNLYFDDSKFLIESMHDALEEVNNNCHDNWRIYLIGDLVAQENYEGKVKNGCCGFYDKKIVHPKSKKEYWVGFNYGH